MVNTALLRHRVTPRQEFAENLHFSAIGDGPRSDSMNIENHDIIIIGGGLAGLTQAAALAAHGISCAMYRPRRSGGLAETRL